MPEQNGQTAKGAQVLCVDNEDSILIGLQVPPDEMGEFARFLDTLGYRYWDETSNPVYKLFLG